MTLLSHNINDPNYQAVAVRAYLDGRDGVEASWCDEEKRYRARVDCAEWQNCRERGFVISLIAPEYRGKQLNIAFFEHRNSDDICAVEWVQNTHINPPNINTAKFDGAYESKWDVSHSVPYGHAGQMADWIIERLEEHWKSNAEATS